MRLSCPLVLLVMFLSCSAVFSQPDNPFISKIWKSDNGDGTYRNPILWADYSDPDVCRVGKDYWMTSSSFNCIPGLPILHSRDLVNWELVGHALPRQEPDTLFRKIQHGKGVWAPSIRYHKGVYYIYWGDPDYGFWRVQTTDPTGTWSKPELVMDDPNVGLEDCCPLWDEDGKVYFSHGLAGSRSGLKSVLCMAEMTPDANAVKGDSRIIYDGHETNPTIEGTKLYKRNGYYYIFAPAGGVSTGWQTVLRSKDIWGPYEERIVLAQGNTPINGPHQGAWVDTPSGEDWFIHFQDVGACGRIVHLQPMKWIDDWPVIGEDPDGDGCGQPVMVHTKPDLSRQPICTPPDDDEFNANSLGLQWQWNANTRRTWCYTDQQKGHLRIYSQYTEHAHSLWDAPNLLQKLSGPNFTATTKVFVQKDKRYTGERFSFVMMGGSYSSLTIESTVNGLILKQIECQKANKKGKEIVHEQILLTEKDSASLLLRITMTDGKNCTFHYSLDGKTFQPIGQSFKAEKGRWIGAKIGYAVQRPKKSNDGGWMDIDWIRFTKPEDQLPKQ